MEPETEVSVPLGDMSKLSFFWVEPRIYSQVPKVYIGFWDKQTGDLSTNANIGNQKSEKGNLNLAI